MNQTNREYKNSVFKDLFSDEETALDLYNALTDSSFTIDDGLRFTTLENALFMGQLNDVSFTVSDKLVIFIEHQASISPNMPIRALMYIGRVYEKIIDRRAIYRTKFFTIPTPEFYVLYNGTDAYPDEKTLRLSDAFRCANIPGVGGENFQPLLPALELTVRVLNVNVGHNEKILEKCDVLRDYTVFIGQVRGRQRAGLTLKDAIAAAIDFCIANGILVEYLKNKGSEVRNMLFTEFNIEEAKEVWAEEIREEEQQKNTERLLEIARAMFTDGDSLEKIARNTGMPLETLKEKLIIQ